MAKKHVFSHKFARAERVWRAPDMSMHSFMRMSGWSLIEKAESRKQKAEIGKRTLNDDN
jgi:hypothetical protein